MTTREHLTEELFYCVAGIMIVLGLIVHALTGGTDK